MTGTRVAPGPSAESPRRDRGPRLVVPPTPVKRACARRHAIGDGRRTGRCAPGAPRPREMPREIRWRTTTVRPRDPGRRDIRLSGFGAGAHFRAGAPLARAEAGIASPVPPRRFTVLVSAGAAACRDRPAVPGRGRFPVAVGREPGVGRAPREVRTRGGGLVGRAKAPGPEHGSRRTGVPDQGPTRQGQTDADCFSGSGVSAVRLTGATACSLRRIQRSPRRIRGRSKK